VRPWRDLDGLRMEKLLVKPVRTRHEELQFLQLPWEIYRGDPHWVPPLRGNQRRLAGFAGRWPWGPRRHPFYEQAECQTFLACRGATPCGRVAAILNHAHNAWYREQRGFFGFFDSADDPEAAHGLLSAVRDWLAERGVHLIRGPMNPSQNYEIGLLVEGFDSPPYFMMTYNRPYYGRLIERFGFRKAQDLYAFWGHVDMLDSLDKKLAFISQSSAERFNIRLRPLDKARFRREVELFLDIYNQSLSGTWGFVPLSQSETRYLAKMLKHLIVPELTVFAEVDGKTVGSVFGLLDYNTRIREIDGRLFPFGFLRLIRDRRSIQRVRLISTNVLPAYQKWGVGLVMLSELLPNVLQWGIKEAEFSWVLETNHLSRGSLEKGGARRTKTYRIYDYTPLGAAGSP
jgi:GNAT superfamily N-acetyltransferase